DEGPSDVVRAAVVTRRLHDLAPGTAHHRIRIRVAAFQIKISGDCHQPVGRRDALQADRTGDSRAPRMKRLLIIGGAVLVLAIIVFASVRATGTKAEKVYA